MTNDLISLEEAIKMIRENGLRGEGYSREEREDNLVDMLECLPAVDAAPVVHAHWIDRDGKTWCSECGASNKAYKPPFCPHCGAKMDKEESDV